MVQCGAEHGYKLQLKQSASTRAAKLGSGKLQFCHLSLFSPRRREREREIGRVERTNLSTRKSRNKENRHCP
ncbi:hypothetical protein L6164_012607 [Bauhinia variegata]|uniref:Uncharacterized protein n=1 Tax=Bauhinia variegata TaxID=167791 RepID=A0ACB9PAX5_BAUVA|nr:hypothetical protein L6164_012607 [Bauhinia variegata]